MAWIDFQERRKRDLNLLSLTAVELGKKIKAHEVTVEEATRDALDAIN